MNENSPWERKYKKLQQQNFDEEQIERTLNFFDAMLDPYLIDDEELTGKHSCFKLKSVPHANNQSKKQTLKNMNSAHRFNYSSNSQNHLNTIIPNINSSFQPMTTSTLKLDESRRFTSESNLVLIKDSHIIDTNKHPNAAISINDLSSMPSRTKLSSPDHMPTIVDRTDISNVSASLIDLTSIDKLSTRPIFRFIPASSENLLSEDNDIEKQFYSKSEQFRMKTISSDELSSNKTNKTVHHIVKPTVIIPVTPKSTPITSFIETTIHHEDGFSAFKPLRSTKTDINKTNSMNVINAGQNVASHSRIKSSDHHSEKHSVPTILREPISRRIQQINNTSSMNGLVNPSLSYGLTNPPNKQTYPYGSSISTNSDVSPLANGHVHYHPNYQYHHQGHVNGNHVRITKQHYGSQYLGPIQSNMQLNSDFIRTRMFPSLSNIYHFDEHNMERDQQLKLISNRPNQIIGTYL